MLPFLLAENNLLEAYKVDQTNAIFELAKKIGAEGVIISTAEGSEASRSVVYAKAELSAQLVAVDSKAIVTSSIHDERSMFVNVNELVQISSDKIIADLNEAIIRIKTIQ
ncbi:hypothetical protein [Pseudoalteromonas tunicata]|jgi:hypothetical protein|uniref:Uncharacterized protein n=1 Tax=Pseudoalteromonas tunicata D2 TaxID=87626 RepID=A4CFF1_9GAMM|nr:hypothetical protein [Pseudoalteromonas tunicata]ATC95161.1 hypothetical protein PTUN_a2722 [Pseudoalteromonas tunicata]AXT30777.1 hypothetical protein D1819_08095 [Pseudoalteromonas tunicata]EAR26489.1 hypothetical protein PTD2_22447 [Pseudoalteromonas tunicata D2]